MKTTNPSKGTSSLSHSTDTLVRVLSAGVLACALGSGCVTTDDDETSEETIGSVAAPAFGVGDAVQTTVESNVRSTGAPVGPVVGTQAAGAKGVIVAGPAAVDGFVRWKVDFANGADGWVLDSRLAKVVGAIKGTKWYPGAYLEVVSPGMTKSGATRWDEAPYTTFLDLPNAAGYMLNVGWAELEATKGVYTLGVIGTVLDYAHSKGKKLILVVYDRSFAGDTSGHLPDYLKNVGPGKMDCSFVTTSGKRRSLKWYKPACVDRIISLYSKIGQSYDAHPALAGVSVGYLESAIEESGDQPDFNDLDTLGSEQLRGAVDSKPFFPTTPVGVGSNWAQNLLERGQYYGAHKGFAFFHADSPPGQWYGGDKDKNGQPDATQAEVLWKGKVPTFAKSEQTFVDESIPNIEKKQWDFQVNTIGASFFIWTPASAVTNYVQNRVLPFMKTNPKMPAANLACPTTYAPCITK